MAKYQTCITKQEPQRAFHTDCRVRGPLMPSTYPADRSLITPFGSQIRKRQGSNQCGQGHWGGSRESQKTLGEVPIILVTPLLFVSDGRQDRMRSENSTKKPDVLRKITMLRQVTYRSGRKCPAGCCISAPLFPALWSTYSKVDRHGERVPANCSGWSLDNTDDPKGHHTFSRLIASTEPFIPTHLHLAKPHPLIFPRRATQLRRDRSPKS